MILLQAIWVWGTVLKYKLLIFSTIFYCSLGAHEKHIVSKWEIKENSLKAVISLFNKARKKENLPALNIDLNSWSTTDDTTKMFELINEERLARGISEFKGISQTLNTISQSYADTLINYSKIGHRTYGGNSWNRIASDPKISTCYERIDYAENISWFKSNIGYQPFYIERSVFTWLYNDARHDWRHRHMLLYRNFTYNNESSEGLIGVGVAHGPMKAYKYNTIVILNLFDPCKKWKKIKGNLYE